LAGYDNGASARRLTVPLRAINGDLYQTNIQGVRKIKADFDAVVMKHTGHYPMLERPAEFHPRRGVLAKCRRLGLLLELLGRKPVDRRERRDPRHQQD
jgi:pimeloyl-ACP methyl ester carboxylesterase